MENKQKNLIPLPQYPIRTKWRGIGATGTPFISFILFVSKRDCNSSISLSNCYISLINILFLKDKDKEKRMVTYVFSSNDLDKLIWKKYF